MLGIHGLEIIGAGTGTIATNTVRIYPIYVPARTVAFTKALCEITGAVAATAGSVGIYNEDGVLVTSASVDTTSTGIKTVTLSPSVELPAGNYYVAATSNDVATVVPTWRGQTPANVLNQKGVAVEASSGGALPASIVPASITSDALFLPYVSFY